jgi:hypothetical protein
LVPMPTSATASIPSSNPSGSRADRHMDEAEMQAALDTGQSRTGNLL